MNTEAINKFNDAVARDLSLSSIDEVEDVIIWSHRGPRPGSILDAVTESGIVEVFTGKARPVVVPADVVQQWRDLWTELVRAEHANQQQLRRPSTHAVHVQGPDGQWYQDWFTLPSETEANAYASSHYGMLAVKRIKVLPIGEQP